MTPATRHGLHFFGRPKLITRSGDQLQLRPNLWRILAILAAGPSEGTARARLIELTLPGGKAGTLRKALWDLREVERKASTRIVAADGSAMRLADELYCDVRDLVSSSSTSDLARLYRGRFLELPDNIDHSPWTSWLEEQRSRYESIYIAKASATLAQAVTRPTAAREAERLLEVDPHNEAATRVRMLSEAANGNLERAQTVYHALRERLEQLGRRPDDQTTDLYFRLRSPVGPRDFDIGGQRRDPGIPSLCLLKPHGDRARAHGWHLARSLVVDVTIGLCRTSLIRIIAPHTAEQIADPSDLACSAAVTDYAVSTEVLGHVSKPDVDQVVFTLYRVASRQILWTERVDIVDRLSVEAYNLLTAELMKSLVQWIDQTEIGSFSLRADPSAYVMFLAGQQSLSSLDLPSIRRGRIVLAKAFRQSPSFAPTISAMARSYQLEWLLTARGDPDLLEQSELYARSAVEVDPYEARGYRELGFCWLYRKDFDRCLEQYERAERLSPQHADIIADYADALVHDGQLESALQKINRAIDLNPLCQDTYHWTRGAAYYFKADYSGAIASILRMRDQTPALRLLAAAYAQRGDKAEASRCKTKAMEVYPDMTVAKWTDIVPFRDPRQVRHYIEGLREAGFR